MTNQAGKQLPNTKLAAVMRLAGMSHGGLAKRVVELAAQHNIHRHYTHIDVRRWLDGTQPRGIIPSLIAQVLSAKLGRPLSLIDIGFTPSPDVTLLRAATYPKQLADAAGAVVALARADGSSEGALGREAVDAAIWGDLMVQWLLAPDVPPPSAGDWEDGSVRAVTWATEFFSRLDYQFGGGYARSSLLEYLRTELTPLLGRPDAVAPALLRPAAALLRLAGWTAYDIGQHGLATGYLAQALRFAQEAGDRALVLLP